MGDLVVSVLASVAASGAFVALLVGLTHDWISTRLRAGIQHEYDQKLEALKAQLKAQADVALVEARAAIERHASVISVAHSSMSEGQKAAMERRLVAIDCLWKRLVALRASLPPILTFMDLLTVEEYPKANEHPTFQAFTQSWSETKIGQLVDVEIELVRPYVGEVLWAYYFAYQAVMLRIVFLLLSARDHSKKIEWYRDDGTRQIVRSALTDQEFATFDSQQFDKIIWLQRILDSKVLSAAQRVISGEEFGVSAIEQARAIQQKVSEIGVEAARA